MRVVAAQKEEHCQADTYMAFSVRRFIVCRFFVRFALHLFLPVKRDYARILPYPSTP